MEDSVLGYVAGMVDGDGTISDRFNNKGQGRVVLQVTNTFLPLMEQLQDWMGGHITTKSSVCEDPCQRSHLVHSRKQSYRWVIQGERAIIVLEAIIPHLIEKKDKAISVATEGRQRLKPNGGKGVQVEMRLRGW